MSGPEAPAGPGSTLGAGAPVPAPPEVPSAEGPAAPEARCPACGAPPSPGRWCVACGVSFDTPPKEGAFPEGGGAVSARKFSCGGCGALMQWDAATQGLVCHFCGGRAAVPREEGYVAVEHDLESGRRLARRADSPKVFQCDDCGAQVTYEGTTVAATCPFCGATAVVERTGDPDRVRPGSVLPFAVSRDDALGAWRTWLGKGLFRPRALRAEAAGEGLRGVYLPFWTYDARTWSRWTATSGTYYWVTVPDGRGGTRQDRRVRWSPAAGERDDAYDDVLVPASRGLDARLLEKVLPYPLEALQPYRSEYLSGWFAEEYVTDLSQGWARARTWINEEEVRRCAAEVPGDTHRDLRVWTQHGDVRWKHLLLPLWIASYRFREKTYRFLVNGSTGEVAGTAPVSALRVAVAVALGLALAAGAWLLLRR